jgi:uncharacterized protein
MSQVAVPFSLWNDTRRVAVLGTSSSGKTVFLTSLIDRLLRNNRRTISSYYGNYKLNISRVDCDFDMPEFPYAYYRDDCLRIQRWPDKSVSSSAYKLRQWRESEGFAGFLAKQTSRELSLFDIPGERIADFSLAGRSYAEWSDEVLGTLRSAPYVHHSEPFLRLLEANLSEITENDLLLSYKGVLARLSRHLNPLVTPSTFLVDHLGKYPAIGEAPAHVQSVEELVESRICGLHRQHQFVPLPERVRENHIALKRDYERRFEQYRDTIANPLGAGFLGADQLIILIDIAAILEGGPEIYHGTRRNLQLAVEYLDPRSPRGGRLHDLTMRFLTGGRKRAGGIQEILIVATKADCVHRLDRANLEPLLHDLTFDILDAPLRERGIRISYLECAAIESTESLDDYPYMTGYIMFDDPGKPRRARFPVSGVPAEWPAESVWRDERFAYASPEPPELDLLGRRPFPGINMDRVTDFIGWSDP